MEPTCESGGPAAAACGGGLPEPGETGERELFLGRGKRYRLWCSLPFHRERGMRATLKISRRSNPA